MFPKGMALVEDSPYTDAIREQKPKKKSTSKIQADSLNLKMKDIIKETIVELGDPVSFLCHKFVILDRYMYIFV